MHITAPLALFMSAITVASPARQAALVNIGFDLNTKDTAQCHGQQAMSIDTLAEFATKDPSASASGTTYNGTFKLRAHQRYVPGSGDWFLNFFPYEENRIGTVTENRWSLFQLTDRVLQVEAPPSSNSTFSVGWHKVNIFPRKIALVKPDDPESFKFVYNEDSFPSRRIWLDITSPNGVFEVELGKDEEVALVGLRRKWLV